MSLLNGSILNTHVSLLFLTNLMFGLSVLELFDFGNLTGFSVTLMLYGDPLISLPTKEDGCLAKASLKKIFRDTVEITLYYSEFPYIVIPSHFYQDREDKFEITCYSSRNCEFKEILKKENFYFEKILSFWNENQWGPHWRLDLFKSMSIPDFPLISFLIIF